MIFPRKRLIKPRLGARINKGHPLAKGLVGYWLMNEGTGNTVQDLSLNNNIGTLVSDVIWQPGKFGPALYFTGVTDYITVPDNGTLRFNSATQDFTISVWVNTLNEGAQYVIGKMEASDDGWRVLMAGGVVWFSVDDADVKGVTNIADGKWHHITAVANRPGNGQVYIDGVADGAPVSLTVAGAMDTTTPMIIGTIPYATNSSEYVGLMDNISIDNRALSASEVAQLYREPFGMFERDEIVLWQPGAGEPPTGNAGIMTTWGGHWGATY